YLMNQATKDNLQRKSHYTIKDSRHLFMKQETSMTNSHTPYVSTNLPSEPYDTIDAIISPRGQLNILSKIEVSKLLDASQSGLYKLFRSCSLAVLNCGNFLDDGKELLERYSDFSISIIQEERGIKLDVRGAPASAF